MRRIPITVAEFVTWLRVTNTFLKSDDPDNPGHKQWERLGLSNAESTAWDDNNTAVEALYAKYSDDAQRTLAVMRQLRALRLNITKGTRPIVNRIASSAAATELDATVFNFVLTRKQPTRRTTQFTESVIVGLKRLGSGEFDFQFRYSKDTKLPSLLPGADEVEYSYKVSTTQPADPATVDPDGDGFRIRSISKPRLIFKSGTANKSKFLLIAFRWSYSKNADLAGPWSEVQVMVIA
jgi:hypothetical protein